MFDVSLTYYINLYESNFMDVIMDPGSKNYAITFIKNGVPVWMGYHPAVIDFQPKNINSILYFQAVSKLLVERADRLIIERYINRKATKGASPEKLNLMIGITLGFACKMKYPPIPITSSSWKRKVDYDGIVNFWSDIGCLKKDKHFCDCLVMYCVIENKDPFKFIKKGIHSYKLLKAKERILKCKNHAALKKVSMLQRELSLKSQILMQ